MAVETTPLGYKVPDGNDPVRNGDDLIAHNALKNQEHIADLQSRFSSHFDGGSPDTIYASEQTIDGGTV